MSALVASPSGRRAHLRDLSNLNPNIYPPYRGAPVVQQPLPAATITRTSRPAASSFTSARSPLGSDAAPFLILLLAWATFGYFFDRAFEFPYKSPEIIGYFLPLSRCARSMMPVKKFG